MKYLFSIIVLVFSLGINARDYLPILKEGRVWNCIASPTLQRPYPLPFQIYVAEEVVKSGHVCRVIRDKDDGDEICTVYEEDGKLYAVDGYFKAPEDPPLLMLNFNLEKGDAISDNLYVSDVDSIGSDGVIRKRLAFSSRYNTSIVTTYWIEGIGTTNDYWAVNIPQTGGPIYMESCYDDGVCVFKNNTLPDWTSGIETVKTNVEATDNKTFDIYGRNVKDQSYKGIVIKGGKKFLKR